MSYRFRAKSNLDFEKTVDNVKKHLQQEGFGILTEIDVRSTLKKKLDVSYDNYLILGACNPPFAYKSLKMEKEIGLLLPCNVIIYEDDGMVYVSAINPVEAMSIVNNEELKIVAKEIGEKLKRIINNLKGGIKD